MQELRKDGCDPSLSACKRETGRGVEIVFAPREQIGTEHGVGYILSDIANRSQFHSWQELSVDRAKRVGDDPGNHRHPAQGHQRQQLVGRLRVHQDHST